MFKSRKLGVHLVQLHPLVLVVLVYPLDPVCVCVWVCVWVCGCGRVGGYVDVDRWVCKGRMANEV